MAASETIPSRGKLFGIPVSDIGLFPCVFMGVAFGVICFFATCFVTILALLFWRAIRQPQKKDPRPWRWDEAGLAITLVFTYPATDEFHQVFVPQRTAMVSDIFIDVTGGAIGLLLLWAAGKFLKRW